MTLDTILQTLSLWLAGGLPKDTTLLGCPLAFWDRLGHVLEFVGVIAVVVDFLGAERLSAIARELREWPTSMLVRPRAAAIGIAVFALIEGLTLLSGTQTIDPVLPFTTIAVPSAVAFAVTTLGLAISSYLILGLYVALFCVAIPPVADYMARVLDREHADKWLRLISMPLLTLGFFLDLLA
jgi:hypothetical protein